MKVGIALNEEVSNERQMIGTESTYRYLERSAVIDAYA